MRLRKKIPMRNEFYINLEILFPLTTHQEKDQMINNSLIYNVKNELLIHLASLLLYGSAVLWKSLLDPVSKSNRKGVSMKRLVSFENCRAILTLGIIASFVFGSAQAIDSRQHDLMIDEYLIEEEPGLDSSNSLQAEPLYNESESAQGMELSADDPDSIAPVEESKPKEEDSEPEPPFHGLILQAADRHQVDPALIKAIIMAESGYNPRAVSKKGARGLMQLMPRTAKSLGVKDSLDPEHNINGGVKYFSQLLNRFNGNVKLALAAYNAGARYVRQYQGVPPFGATRVYIKKVLKFQKIYKEEMAAEDNLTLSANL
jgi:hypothetical protein